MPNWCQNILQITAKSKTLQNILTKYFTNGKIDFDKIIPQPKTQQECEEKYQEYVIHNEEEAKEHCLQYENPDKDWFNWYDWNRTYWGTKWNASYYDDEEDIPIDEDITDDHQDTAWISFDTAWSPPIPIYEALAKLCPDATIYATWFESGMCFAGYFQDGVVYDVEDVGEFALENDYITDEEYNEYYANNNTDEE